MLLCSYCTCEYTCYTKMKYTYSWCHDTWVYRTIKQEFMIKKELEQSTTKNTYLYINYCQNKPYFCGHNSDHFEFLKTFNDANTISFRTFKSSNRVINKKTTNNTLLYTYRSFLEWTSSWRPSWWSSWITQNPQWCQPQ